MMPLIAICAFILAAASAEVAVGQGTGPSSEADLTVSGILEQLDLSTSKGMLKTPTGKPVFFEIVKPELFRNISVGERVTIQLDERGRAVKAIESHSIPEMPAPSQ